MELIYSSSLQASSKSNLALEDSIICTLSTQNIIALSSSTTLTLSDNKSTLAKSVDSILEESDADIRDNKSVTFTKTNNSVKYHVFVCDINEPWLLHEMTSFSHQVTLLKWNAIGRCLLIGTQQGIIEAWQMKDSQLNVWTLVGRQVISSENIVALDWLQKSMIAVVAEKREEALYSDKMTRQTHAASLYTCGRVAATGWVAITQTSLVYVGIINDGSSSVMTAVESLFAQRSDVRVADLAFNADGSITVATSDGSVNSPLHFVRLSLHMEDDVCTIAVKPCPGLCLRSHFDSTLASNATVTHLKFLSRESDTNVLVGIDDDSQSVMEIWKMTSHQLTVHRHFTALHQQNSGSDETPLPGVVLTNKWTHEADIRYAARSLSVACPQLYIVGDTSPYLQYIAISYRDGNLRVVNRHGFQVMTMANLDMSILGEGATERKVVPYLSSVCQSLSGYVLVGVDQNGSLYAMQMVNTRDPMTQVGPPFLVSMLEYCLVAGVDWWDVAAVIKPAMVDAVLAKLSENFARQPQAMQELFTVRLLAIRTTLHRSVPGDEHKAADVHCLIYSHLLASLMAFFVRSHSVGTQDKSVASFLRIICSKSPEADLNKLTATVLEVVSDLDTAETGALAGLQPSIQWLTDVCLYLLAWLPDVQAYSSLPGHTLVRHKQFLSTVRFIIVLARIWGRHAPQHVLPQYTVTAVDRGLDVLAAIFRLITALWRIAGEGGEAADEDECCRLATQVITPPLCSEAFGRANTPLSIMCQPHPVRFTYGSGPASLPPSLASLPDGQRLPDYVMDVRTKLTLGLTCRRPRHVCSRCGSSSLVELTSTSSAMSTWLLLWKQACYCGGHWRLVDG